jgi:uncharacterized repeat protein (TIGR03843 family)
VPAAERVSTALVSSQPVSPGGPPPGDRDVDPDELRWAPLRVIGRFATASNATLLAELESTSPGTGRPTGTTFTTEDAVRRTPGRLGRTSRLAAPAEGRLRVVYKPTRGTRSLWDFEAPSLARHEVAAYQLAAGAAAILGEEPLVPLTVMREAGPFGEGAVQLFMDVDDRADLVDVFPVDAMPDSGWLVVFGAEDRAGNDLVVAHADVDRLRRMALLDEVINNADRKGQHVLTLTDGRVVGIDHGLCFHVDDKLRTVLWGYAGEPLEPGDLAFLQAMEETVAGDRTELAALLSGDEYEMLLLRLEAVRLRGTFADPPYDRHPIPWPPL